jgi:periplasmic glucans biosynthesis protein
MPLTLSRRQFLSGSALLALELAPLPALASESVPGGIRYGKARAFDFDQLRLKASRLAGVAFEAETPPAPDIVQAIDFDAAQKIKFRPERALWSGDAHAMPVRMFHLDKFNGLPVRINVVSDGMARAVIYARDDFDYGDTALAEKLPVDLGFCGFRVMNGPDADTDWLAFQGASYFRTCGEENQYGASARGIAIDTALKEEFPRFVEFWLEEKDNAAGITIYALLNGPSLTGAYKFDATKEAGAVIGVTAELNVRKDIERLGIAPLTSMYWYAEGDRPKQSDWRPEIHDSDGLALHTGGGERIWRPLINPAHVKTNSFFDTNPKAFGLMQRDRRFVDYEDDGAFYNRRPSIWIEPVGEWGEGAVQLVEIPTGDEVHDNIVAYWTRKKPVKAGDKLVFSYRTYWQNDEPSPPADLARAVATRTGVDGIPGTEAHYDVRRRKFVVDWEGGPLTGMAPRFDITPVVTASHGAIGNAYVVKVVGTEKWRALFDLAVEGKSTVDLRCYLRLGDQTLTETWLYQYSVEA